ncbi:uncharacterized protein LOC144121539 isoform X1 [Amblyomma americanum]
MQAVLGLFTDYGSVYVHHTLLEMRLSLAILLLATLFVALVDCRKVYGRRDKRKHNEVDDLGAGWTYLRKVRKQCSHILNDSPIREIQEPDGSRCKDQKYTRALVSADLLSEAEKDAAFANCITAEDETWCFQYDPQTKRQSAEWRITSAPASRKDKRLSRGLCYKGQCISPEEYRALKSLFEGDSIGPMERGFSPIET